MKLFYDFGKAWLFYSLNSVGWGNWDAAGIPSFVTSAHFIFFRRWLILSLWFLASSASVIA